MNRVDAQAVTLYRYSVTIRLNPWRRTGNKLLLKGAIPPSPDRIAPSGDRCRGPAAPSALRKWVAFAVAGMVNLASHAPANAAASPQVEIHPPAAQTVELTWTNTGVAIVVERTSSLKIPIAWESLALTPVTQGDRVSVRVGLGAGPQFYRLRQGAGTAATVVDTSPAAGESGVAVTRESIFRLSAPLASDVVLSGDDLHAEFGGRKLLARAELSSDRRTATLFYLENVPASARIRVTLDGTKLRDTAGLALDADGDGQPGGSRVLEFLTAGITGLENTAVIGKVFASEKNPDGSNHPLEGAIVSVDGADETLRTTTDSTGSFVLSPAPAGRFFVHVDGRTAVGSRWPVGAYYPFVGKAWEAVPGKTNNLAGGSGEIFLPLIQSDALQSVSATETTKVTFAPSVLTANPALAGVEVNVPANSLFSDNGARGGKVGIAPVPPDRLPEPLPPGLDFPLVITVQTDGGANFDRPVPVKFPNLPDPKTGVKLPPGATTVLWSFNHDTGRWEPQGTMTISPDGQFAISDPGVGIRQPGWHGTAPGTGGGGPSGGPPPPGCPPYCGPQPDPPCNEPDACGHLHYLYIQALEDWRKEAELKESFTIGSVVALGKIVDQAYAAYLECREANGRPCQGASGRDTHAEAATTTSRGLAPASLPADVTARFNAAIQHTINEQNSARSGSPLPGPGTWFALRSLDSGFVQLGRLNSIGSVENLILAPSQLYRMSYYDAVHRRGGSAYFRSKAAGAVTYIPYAILFGAEFGAPPDADADGLSDFAEGVIGSFPGQADTDGDGIKDGQELNLGTNPLDGVGLPKGVIGSVLTPGAAYDVAVDNGLAVLACASGVSVVDVSNPQTPVQVAIVPEGCTAVALRGRLALVATSAALRLLDLTNPSSPLIRWSRTDLNAATAVAFGDSSVLVHLSSQLHRLDPATGAARGVLQVGSCDSLAARGELVYVLVDNKLTICRDADYLELVGTVNAPGSGGAGGRPRQLFIAGDLLYAQQNSGFNVLDLLDPASPVLLKNFQSNQAGWRDLALTGTGWLLAADGPNSVADGPHDVSLYRVQAGGTEAQFITTFVTPGEAYAVTIAGARGYVADGTAGLAVVNFLEVDSAGVAPTVSVGVDSAASPPQVEGGRLAHLSATASDDVAVQYVDFFINGEVVARDESYPFEVFQRMPPVSPTNPSFELRARAVDTAGNASDSAILIVRIVPDATPPAMIQSDPAADTTIPTAVIRDFSATFDEPIVTPVTATTLTLRTAGADGKFDTADDVPVSGEVQWLVGENTIRFRGVTPFVTGRYQVTLSAGLADAAGNVRSRPLRWQFVVGQQARVLDVFPPANFVRVGGVLDYLEFGFDQPVQKILADTYVWKVTRRPWPTDGSGTFGPLAEITPLQVTRSADGRRYTLRTPANFPPGQYVVSGAGPNVQGMRWEFVFRDVPNEATGTVVGAGTGLGTSWKYYPGPGVNDVLRVNLPGVTAPIEARDLKSLIAQSPIQFRQQVVNVQEPIQALGGLDIIDARFGPGETHVRGPLFVSTATGNPPNDVGPHTINVYGGGVFRVGMRFSDPNGALVNHPGSSLVWSNNANVGFTGIGPTNRGRLVNLGTLRMLAAPGVDAPPIRLEEVRLRNDGRLEAATGKLRIAYFDNEGEINVAAGAKILLPSRFHSGVSSRLTGDGDIEFGEYIAGRRPVVSLADADIRGDFDTQGNVTLAAGSLTFWRPFVHPAGRMELQNDGTLNLLGGAQIGTLTMRQGNLVANGDVEIQTYQGAAFSSIRTATRLRVHGTATLDKGFEAFGPGVVEFLGATTLSDLGQGATVLIGNGLVRNLGTWRYTNALGSHIGPRPENGKPSTGTFENAGVLEMASGKGLTITCPFRNAGRIVGDAGPIVIDGRQSGGVANLGAFIPLPGSEFVLNGTAFRQAYKGTLDLAAGTLRGTGSIEPGVAAGDVVSKVTNRSVIRVGNPTGELFVRAQNFEQTSTGETIVTLSATGNSLLRLRESATLAGTLTVELAPGFTPPLGAVYNVISYNGRTGEFQTVNLPNLGAGRKLTIVYGTSNLAVKVVAQ
ncbi:MAG: Ig-like domain-containing protein [Verrucomicrobiales bacterium]|nr:Ig-like domain-containing protein [Verrucomicrobiales bacterium]